MDKNKQYLPENDGIDHINMYSKANTEFGKMLSNFYRFPIKTPDGDFMSVEGYWYWMSIEPCEERETLRSASGFSAKQLGKDILKEKAPAWDVRFETKILNAIWYKFKRNAHLMKPEYEALPICHYYNYKGHVVDVTDRYDWMIHGIEKMRDRLVHYMETGKDDYVKEVYPLKYPNEEKEEERE